jgi:hypothetical protein
MQQPHFSLCASTVLPLQRDSQAESSRKFGLTLTDCQG